MQRVHGHDSLVGSWRSWFHVQRVGWKLEVATRPGSDPQRCLLMATALSDQVIRMVQFKGVEVDGQVIVADELGSIAFNPMAHSCRSVAASVTGSQGAPASGMQ